MSELFVGIDVGSTTVKVVLTDANNNIIHKDYKRHMSAVRDKVLEMLSDISELCQGKQLKVSLTGSGALSLSKITKLPFVQEVFSCAKAVRLYYPQTDAAIELGGEDAKIIFFGNSLEERMNGSCAGGTGSFIDQMATLLNVTADEFDELYKEHEKIYDIASRCGVFAKSDIQPLLNQGAKKADLVASVYAAVVNQTIAGLAQGRKINGNVIFLGGPLYYMSGLRERFKIALNLDDESAIFPENALYLVAIGAALSASQNKNSCTFEELKEKISNAVEVTKKGTISPLFENQQEYDEFLKRHEKATLMRGDIKTYKGNAYLGIDAGSTTTKLVLISENNEILFEYYNNNNANPVKTVKRQFEKLLPMLEDRIEICGSAVTGYGEELIKSAFGVDLGLVETIAHLTAAQYFKPDVDFILDIGGQDIKCFSINDGVIDSIMLNEACSSGCGSFLETYAKVLSFTAEEFGKKALFAKHPVDLGSRCTVFMNSSIKQAQKDGAQVEDISAGLAMSVVKNALYKVIRINNLSEMKNSIVVQGGTFYNDAVLRAFEREVGKNVVRPDIAGLMGAFGAALYAKKFSNGKSTLITADELKEFTHTTKTTVCKGCTNHCPLTVNYFGEKKGYISGNRCEKPLGKTVDKNLLNLYDFKYKKLMSLKSEGETKGKIGIPMGLNMYENLPFWFAFWTELGYEVVLSEHTTKQTYLKGQSSIPSDTVCYPAKLMHGAVESLLEKGVTDIFYPCLPYNFNEHMSDNCYNCPVVAYYPELLKANMESLSGVRFINPYFAIHRKNTFKKGAYKELSKYFDVTKKQINKAAECAYKAYDAYRAEIRSQGEKALHIAKEEKLPIIVLASRPYHIDPEVNHGIPALLTSLGFVVVSEDSVYHLVDKKTDVKVLNQWTYHSRMYNAAKLTTTLENAQMVQLVSFGCGIDAITSDEIKDILESSGKLYTQLKIDEINNLGAVRIRLRSLQAAMNIKDED